MIHIGKQKKTLVISKYIGDIKINESLSKFLYYTQVVKDVKKHFMPILIEYQIFCIGG